MYSTVIATAALAATAFAAPAASPAPVQSLFSLKATADDPRFNNLCVQGYHTGAGTADATLTACDDSTNIFYTNNTNIGSTIFGTDPTLPAGLYAPNGATYDDWYPVTLGTGYGTSGFKYFQGAGYSQENGAGFLACRWAHGGVAQLFSFAYPGVENFITDNCALIKLDQA